MASSNVIDGYPTPWGNKKASVFYHTGPASYVQMVVAAPPTGGDPLSDVEAGLRFLDFVDGGISDNGQFRVEAVSSSGNPSQAQGAGQGGTVGSSPRTWRLRWIVVATGAEVAGAVNLSGRTVRLLAIGRS